MNSCHSDNSEETSEYQGTDARYSQGTGATLVCFSISYILLNAYEYYNNVTKTKPFKFNNFLSFTSVFLPLNFALKQVNKFRIEYFTLL